MSGMTAERDGQVVVLFTYLGLINVHERGSEARDWVARFLCSIERAAYADAARIAREEETNRDEYCCQCTAEWIGDAIERRAEEIAE